MMTAVATFGSPEEELAGELERLSAEYDRLLGKYSQRDLIDFTWQELAEYYSEEALTYALCAIDAQFEGRHTEPYIRTGQLYSTLRVQAMRILKES